MPLSRQDGQGRYAPSYGGSFALLAAADPRLRGRVERVAAFGAYWDLAGVVQAITTGVSVVDGRPVPWEGHPMARQILQEVASRFVPPEQRDALDSALDGRGDPAALSEEARSLYDLLTNRDPARTAGLVGRLPEEAQRFFREFSPSSVAARIGAPVIAMHSTDDPAVPYGEALRLVGALPGTRLVTVSLFRHVDLRASSPGGWVRAAGDLWSAWRFTSWLLGAQE